MSLKTILDSGLDARDDLLDGTEEDDDIDAVDCDPGGRGAKALGRTQGRLAPLRTRSSVSRIIGIM